MRIARAELFELTLPLVEPFVISGGAITERRSLIVALHDDAGHVGYGESPPFQLPFYSEETLTSARDLIDRVLLPRVVGREFDGPLPAAIDAALYEGVRGNWFARAGVETAAWDLEAQSRGTGLAMVLRERLGVTRAAADCGCERGLRMAARRGRSARARRCRSPLHRAAAPSGRARRARSTRRGVADAPLSGRNAAGCARRIADRGVARAKSLEHQGAPRRRAD